MGEGCGPLYGLDLLPIEYRSYYTYPLAFSRSYYAYARAFDIAF